MRRRPRSSAARRASARRWRVCGGSPRICSSPCLSRGVRRASSTSAWSGRTEPGGAVGAASLFLAPLGQLERDAARRLAQPAEPGKPLVRARRVALVAHVLERARLLARPLEPSALLEPSLQLLAERQQQARVIRGVLELLRRERPLVPAGEPLAALQPDLQHLADERLVALLVAEPEEAGRHLRVEDVVDLGVERAAHDRHVLAPGVQDHLDGRVGEHPGERREVRVPLQRIEHLGPHAALRARVRHRHLHEAQQGLVAAFGHELRVDCQPPSLGGAVR